MPLLIFSSSTYFSVAGNSKNIIYNGFTYKKTVVGNMHIWEFCFFPYDEYAPCGSHARMQFARYALTRQQTCDALLQRMSCKEKSDCRTNCTDWPAASVPPPANVHRSRALPLPVSITASIAALILNAEWEIELRRLPHKMEQFWKHDKSMHFHSPLLS